MALLVISRISRIDVAGLVVVVASLKTADRVKAQLGDFVITQQQVITWTQGRKIDSEKLETHDENRDENRDE